MNMFIDSFVLSMTLNLGDNILLRKNDYPLLTFFTFFVPNINAIGDILQAFILKINTKSNFCTLTGLKNLPQYYRKSCKASTIVIMILLYYEITF